MPSSNTAFPALLLAVTLGLTGCAPSSSSASSTSGTAAAAADSAGAFPVTIKHALGETTIAKRPERVATLGWANHEVPLALGVVPVGMSKATWGDDNKNGVLPWVEDRLKELGAQTPVLFDETDGIDYEAVANTRPDVILAAYSGLTKEQYTTLSKIAPVVAYPKVAWGTTMAEMVSMNSEALGLKEQGAELNTSLKQEISRTAAKYPAIKGKSAMFTFIDTTDLSKIGFYTTLDTRPGFFTELGLTTPKAVAAASRSDATFSATVSAEKSDEFSDVDLLVTYDDAKRTAVKAATANKLWAQIPALKSGAVATLENDTPLAAAANPSPLSVHWGLDKYLALLNTAAGQAK